MTSQYEDIVVETRSGVREIVHQGCISISTVDGEIAATGDTDCYVSLRSLAKPFIVSFLLDKYLEGQTFSEDEIALMSSSHNGEPMHVEILHRLLSRYEIPVDALKCGSHPRFRWNSRVRPDSNNCSGKHAAYLISCVVNDLPQQSYLEGKHPISAYIKERFEEILGCDIEIGVDGCSIPTFAVPLKKVSQLFAHFSVATDNTLSRVREAHLQFPDVVGGSDCLDSYLIRKFGLNAKSGSDGIWAIGIADQRIGISGKVYSGSEAAIEHALLHVLRNLNLVEPQNDSFMKGFYERPRLSWAGHEVGVVKCLLGGFPGDSES